MRIFLTGATGFLGDRVMRCLAQTHSVVALARSPGPEVEGVEWLIGDLLSEIPDPGPIDAIIHLAQSRDYKEFPERAEDISGVNVIGTLRCLRLAREKGVRRFVFASSGGVYGDVERPAVETERVLPIGYYQCTKAAAEHLVRGHSDLFDTTILRFFFIYGPGQQGGMMRSILDRALCGDPILVQGSRGIRCNPVYIDDAADAVVRSLIAEPGTYNVAGPDTMDLREIAEIMREVSGSSSLIEATGGTNADHTASMGRMSKFYGWVPDTSVEAGLRSMFEGVDG